MSSDEGYLTEAYTSQPYAGEKYEEAGQALIGVAALIALAGVALIVWGRLNK